MRCRTVLLCWLPVVALNAQSPPPFTSADAADAAERLTGQRAHAGYDLRLLAGKRVVGPAITMRLVRDDKASLMAEGLAAIKVLETAPPGTVIVVALNDDRNFAVFGATFATLAKSRRLGGFVVDGAMRGLADLKRINVPVLARGTVAGSAGGHYRLDAVNVPVTISGAVVEPGDIVVGDEDGVAIVPRAKAAEVFAKAQSLREEKDAMLVLIARHGSYTAAAEAYKKAHPKP